ncbi:MAG: SAM-dependent methyltransferase, partial [Acidimicrobiales bacterium]
MARYALLLKASANRVYGESTFALAQAELAAFDQVLGGVVVAAERATIGGVDYLIADVELPLSSDDVAVVSNLSALHALFEVDAEGRFCPVLVCPRRVLDEDVVTIQRYAGKTNEAFT